MKDELEAPFLDEWLQTSEVAPPDSHAAARRVASELPHTKQVGRWLPFPVFHRKAKAKTPTAIDTTDYQPSPIPATNGHYATAVGRTQTMFSPAKAITAGALVFAIGSVLLIAQPFDQQGANVPGATSPDPAMAPSFFSGTIGDDTTNAFPVTVRRDDGVVDGTGESYTFTWDMNDPRISGTATNIFNETDYREGATTLAPTGDVGTVRTGVLRVVNDTGSWEGEWTNLQFDNPDWESDAGWLIGAGAYEGLSAYYVWSGDIIRGHITAEGMPPAPELPAAE